MPILQLRRLYVHDAADYTSYVRLWVRSGDRTVTATAERRTMANGRHVMVTSPGVTDDPAYELVDVARVDMQWLIAHANMLLLFRDPRGGKAFGFYPQMPVTELPGVGDTVDLALPVVVVDHDEAVAL